VRADISRMKEQAARAAVEFVQSGMVVGLGHGSTSLFALRHIARLIHEGSLEGVRGVPCSRKVLADARKLGIPLTTLEKHPVIDLTIDGADEVDKELNLIKGGGGALLREKIVAQASLCEVIIVDETKMSRTLGTKCAVPIEVLPFGWQGHIFFLEKLGARVKVRKQKDGTLFKTDQGNIILDAAFGQIKNPSKLAYDLKSRAGIMEHGLFIRIATDVIVAGRKGVRHLVRKWPGKITEDADGRES